MMDFIIMTISFTVAILLSSILVCGLLFSKIGIRLYAKCAVKCMKDFEKILASEMEKEL